MGAGTRRSAGGVYQDTGDGGAGSSGPLDGVPPPGQYPPDAEVTAGRVAGPGQGAAVGAGTNGKAAARGDAS
jgi:hypothetical protein